MFELDAIIRPNIKKLVPYSSARDEFSGKANIFLDANENSLGSPLTKWYNRYPDPHQVKLKEKIAEIKRVDAKQIFLGNGSDECIDLLYRVFCEPGIDNVIICPPTYGMYEVSANINNVAVKKVLLTPAYQLDLNGVEAAIDEHTKMIWICSPNNPTGNAMIHEDVEIVLNNYNGLVVIDEAYVNFSRHKSFTTQLNEYSNLVVLQTLSKAWGLAGLRLGMAFASQEIIDLLNRIKPPYNIGQATQEVVSKALDNTEQVNAMILEIVKQRQYLENELEKIETVQEIYPSDANFLLVKIKNATAVYKMLVENGIIVRDRSRVELCEDCLRVTVGTEQENNTLLELLKSDSE